MTPAIKGSGVAATESREVVEFDQIEISIPVQIEISKGNVCTLELTVDDNLMEHISTTVSNGRLHVSADQNFAMKVPGMLRITSPNLTYVSLAGAVDGTIEELSGESAELHMAGSSEVSVGLLTENLSVHIAGSGTLNASGICKTMEVSIAGSGTVHSENVPVDEVSVSIAGSGDVYVHASQKLDVSIAGSGSVRYKGEPVIEQSVAGSGAIEKLN